MSMTSKKQKEKGKAIDEIRAEAASRFNYENMMEVLKAFEELRHAVRKCYNGKSETIEPLRNNVEKSISDAWYHFILVAKQEGVWEKYVQEENLKTLEFISNEFSEVGGVFRNHWGDEYTYDPVTGLLKQTAWGL